TIERGTVLADLLTADFELEKADFLECLGERPRVAPTHGDAVVIPGVRNGDEHQVPQDRKVEGEEEHRRVVSLDVDVQRAGRVEVRDERTGDEGTHHESRRHAVGRGKATRKVLASDGAGPVE